MMKLFLMENFLPMRITTGMSLQCTDDILNKLNEIKESSKDDLDLAIRLLESTGAGMKCYWLD